jgi:flavin-dependent dehydrogenase
MLRDSGVEINAQTDRPIQIAGAGPSGLAAAIRLASAGLPVTVFEARKAAGARFIGDFQVIENMSGPEDALDWLSRLGLSINFFIQPAHRAVFFGPDLKPHPVESARPFAYFIRRGAEAGSLDTGLAAQAVDAGVRIVYETRLPRDQADIVATGPSTPDGLAKQKVFPTALPDTVWVLFDMARAPGGYAYLFVLNGRATLGCAITRDFDRMDHYFDVCAQRFAEVAPFSMDDARSGYSFMSFSLKTSAQVEGRRFVGEAGGFQDFLFGLGLRYALTTGHLAAESFMGASAAGVAYDTAWKSALGEAQEVSLVNRALYELGGNRGLSFLIRRATRGDVRDYLAGWHAPRAWKRLLLPWVKWRWRRQTRCVHPFDPHWCRQRAEPVNKWTPT